MDYETLDTRAEISEEILAELKFDSLLELIQMFKEYICKEPEFTNINAISSYQILDIFSHPKKTKAHFKLSSHQMELFQEICSLMYDKIFPEEYYNRVAEQILDKIYI